MQKLKFKELKAKFVNEEFSSNWIFKQENPLEIIGELISVYYEVSLGIDNHELLTKNLSQIYDLNEQLIQLEQLKINLK